MATRANIFGQKPVLAKGRVAALLSAGWARIIATHGKGALADALDVSENTIGNALACGSAWKKDPGSGVIGVEKGPLIPVV